jgi:hypothetical protein
MCKSQKEGRCNVAKLLSSVMTTLGLWQTQHTDIVKKVATGTGLSHGLLSLKRPSHSEHTRSRAVAAAQPQCMQRCYLLHPQLGSSQQNQQPQADACTKRHMVASANALTHERVDLLQCVVLINDIHNHSPQQGIAVCSPEDMLAH